MVEFEGEITHEDNKTDDGRYPYYKDQDGAVYVIASSYNEDGDCLYSAVLVFDPPSAADASPGLVFQSEDNFEDAINGLVPAKNFTLKVRTK